MRHLDLFFISLCILGYSVLTFLILLLQDENGEESSVSRGEFDNVVQEIVDGTSIAMNQTRNLQESPTDMILNVVLNKLKDNTSALHGVIRKQLEVAKRPHPEDIESPKRINKGDGISGRISDTPQDDLPSLRTFTGNSQRSLLNVRQRLFDDLSNLLPRPLVDAYRSKPKIFNYLDTFANVIRNFTGDGFGRVKYLEQTVDTYHNKLRSLAYGLEGIVGTLKSKFRGDILGVVPNIVNITSTIRQQSALEANKIKEFLSKVYNLGLRHADTIALIKTVVAYVGQKSIRDGTKLLKSVLSQIMEDFKNEMSKLTYIQ